MVTQGLPGGGAAGPSRAVTSYAAVGAPMPRRAEVTTTSTRVVGRQQQHGAAQLQPPTSADAMHLSPSEAPELPGRDGRRTRSVLHLLNSNTAVSEFKGCRL